MRGLLGRHGLDPGAGLLIRKTGSIHTFFMRFPIDAVFLDKKMVVRRVVAEIPPFRLAWGRGARSVVELARRRGCARGARRRRPACVA